MADSDPAASPLKQSPEKNEELQDSGTKIKQENEVQESSPFSNSPKEEGVQPIGARIKDLDESQSELLSRIQGLKQNVQSWRSLVDTQLKSYKDEMTGLKKQLESELEQLSSDFKELKTTLQKQQEDVTNSLKNLGLQDAPKHSGESEIEEDNSDKAQSPASESKGDSLPAGESSIQ
ncbi:uncharacterized protein A4U43_C08F31510 [Asparagus officinalis]|uniref:CAP-Gly domain-containing linker protein 1 n=1 Tax=Asparagus officinalis TaxID=4686 RepID=UPI00098E715C|nr:CAP-Gly domain-containing linker protein 1 [Asparagus officinalis]ONK61586.1 uncharacterized protein A4U43_C08F31510 [Asparagus officinalis]